MQAFVQAVSDSQLYTYLDVVPPALLTYDTLINFASEVELLWKRRLRLPGFLYLAARYVTLASMTLQVWVALGNSHNLCGLTYRTVSSLALIGATGGHGLAIARIYAVAARKRSILILLFVILIGNMSFMISTIVTASCSTNGGVAVERLVLVGSIFTAAFHIAVFNGTLIHSLGLRKLQRSIMPSGGGRTLTQLFIQQGVVWFFIVFSWNISTIVWNQTMHPDLRNATLTLETAVSMILVSRFFLSLRQFASRPATSYTVRPVSVSTMVFPVTFDRIRDDILEDLGDPEYDETYFARDDTVSAGHDEHDHDIKDHDVKALGRRTFIAESHHRRTITIAEFPWALGNLDLEAGTIQY